MQTTGNRRQFSSRGSWHFRLGGFSYKGKPYFLKGKLRLCLKAIAEANGEPVGIDDLRNAAWGGDRFVEKQTIVNTLWVLRKKLRVLFALAEDVNPVQSVGDGGYVLDI